MGLGHAFSISFLPKEGGGVIEYLVLSQIPDEGSETFKILDEKGGDVVLTEQMSLEVVFGVIIGLMLGGKLRVHRILYHRNRFAETIEPHFQTLCSEARRAKLIPT